MVPASRIRRLTTAAPDPSRDYVMYWMTAQRRTRSNYALQRAVEASRKWRKPLLVFEGLLADYPFASERLHQFVLDGMRDNRAECQRAGVSYLAHVERRAGEGSGLLAHLATRACLVVGDDYPGFFLPALNQAAAEQLEALGVALEIIDGNGLYPFRAVERVFTTAHSFRRHLQRELPYLLGDRPVERPLARYACGEVEGLQRRVRGLINSDAQALDGAWLDSAKFLRSVSRVNTIGGQRAGRAVCRRFVANRLAAYDEQRNHPDEAAASGLSPYLHFGHVGAAEVFGEVAKQEGWDPSRLGATRNGSRAGFWGMSAAAEAFVDQLVTWRELGFNACAHQPDVRCFSSLPPWALATLEAHASDPRRHVYSLQQFEAAETHDELWNAAQRQLLIEGAMHNYLRMLWGKKILEWSTCAEEALDVMLELNDRYALDGRDPNSISGIFWVLGRYDRPWGPERPIFGTVRYMTSDNTRRKLRLKRYLAHYGQTGQSS